MIRSFTTAPILLLAAQLALHFNTECNKKLCWKRTKQQKWQVLNDIRTAQTISSVSRPDWSFENGIMWYACLHGFSETPSEFQRQFLSQSKFFMIKDILITLICPHECLITDIFAIRKYSLNLVNKDSVITTSKLKGEAGVIGACMLARSRMFEC